MVDWSVVVPVVGALAGVGVGVLLNSGSEHRKWLRERRFAAYTAVVNAMRAHSPATADESRRGESGRVLIHACREAELLAPTALRGEMVMLMANAITDRTGDNYRAAMNDVLHLMRKNLGINQRTLKENVLYYYYRARHPIKTRGWTKHGPDIMAG